MPSKTVELNLPTPLFTLVSSAGRPVSLSDYRGRPVILFFIRAFT